MHNVYEAAKTYYKYDYVLPLGPLPDNNIYIYKYVVANKLRLI